MAKKVRFVKNEDVQRVMVGMPSGQRRLHVMVESADEILVFQEATISNLHRAFYWVYDHPQRRALELTLRRLGEAERKKGYAEYQLLETPRAEEEIQLELDQVFASVQP